MKPACVSALVATLIGSSVGFGADLQRALYNPIDIVTLLTIDKGVKAELKLTKNQELAINAGLKQWREDSSRDFVETQKWTGPDKDAKIRARGTQRSKEIFQALGPVLRPNQVKRLKEILLQQWGISLFDHPEIRKDLKLNDQKVVQLRAIHAQMKTDIQKAANGKPASEELRKQYKSLSRGVPDKVRNALSKEQQDKLDDMLGERYSF
jgi:hypothetical protein